MFPTLYICVASQEVNIAHAEINIVACSTRANRKLAWQHLLLFFSKQPTVTVFVLLMLSSRSLSVYLSTGMSDNICYGSDWSADGRSLRWRQSWEHSEVWCCCFRTSMRNDTHWSSWKLLQSVKRWEGVSEQQNSDKDVCL